MEQGRGGIGPGKAGIGLRHPHVGALIERPPPELSWVEIHSENYMADGGPRLRQLELIRERYALSLHGVGLSLGSADEPDRAHLARIRRLIDRFAPALVSEHIAWSVEGGHYLNDLFPLPYTEEALATVARNIAIAQDALGCRILVENPSSYLRFVDSTMPECRFVAEVAERADCGLLLDVNNIHVSAHNQGFDVDGYLAAIPAGRVGEIHLAGHARVEVDGQVLLIDDHAGRVIPAVWQLYEQALARLGPRPTLLEWDNDIPALDVLLDERARAQRRLDGCHHARAA
ncbi:MAG: DUF692 domain-containing protein [Geminicoccaceae bacterium]